LTILFGAIPATFLSVVPAFFLGLGIYRLAAGNGFDEGSPVSFALFALYCLAALYGTLSLWLVPFTGPKRFVIVGLAAGMLVISPFAYAAVFEPWLYDKNDWLYSIFAVLPFLTALCWLTAFSVEICRIRAIARGNSDSSS
jgi:hypothetical protein